MKDLTLGLAAGVIGATLWAGVAAITHYEVGWVAWAVGGLVGVAVARGNVDGHREPAMAGVLAVAITALSIVGGKYLAVSLTLPSAAELIASVMANFDNEEYVMSFVADDVAAELEASGQTVDWPAGVDPSMASEESDYPADVWTEARERWASLSDAERADFQEARRRETSANLDANAAAFRGRLFRGAFAGSFAPLDLIFFGLAIVTAWGIASGRKRKEQVAADYESAIRRVMLHVMWSDGRATDDEIATVAAVYRQVTGKDLPEDVVRAQSEGIESEGEDLLGSLQELAPHLNEAGKGLVVRAAIMVAMADGEVDPGEQALISTIAGTLGVSGAQLQNIIAELAAPPVGDPAE